MAKILRGKVVSNKMLNTIVVEVVRQKKHPKYGKYFRISKRYKAHVEDSSKYDIGDPVVIEGVRPISKQKQWKVKL